MCRWKGRSHGRALVAAKQVSPVDSFPEKLIAATACQACEMKIVPVAEANSASTARVEDRMQTSKPLGASIGVRMRT